MSNRTSSTISSCLILISSVAEVNCAKNDCDPYVTTYDFVDIVQGLKTGIT